MGADVRERDELVTDGNTGTSYVPSDEVMELARRIEAAGGRLVTGDREILDEAPSQREPFVHPWGLRPPAAEAFKDDDETIPFLPAPELEERMHDLIERCNELAFLDSLSIGVLWKASGGKSGGRLTLGKCVRPSGLLAFYSELDFVIWLAADHVREYGGVGLTESQVEALLYHELSHIGWDDDKDAPVVRGHDFAEFRQVVARYGLWLDDAKAMDQVFQQLRLKGVGDV